MNNQEKKLCTGQLVSPNHCLDNPNCVIPMWIERVMAAFLLAFPCAVCIAEIFRVFLYYSIVVRGIFVILPILVVGMLLSFGLVVFAINKLELTSNRGMNIAIVVLICWSAFIFRLQAGCVLNGYPQNDFYNNWMCIVEPETHQSTLRVYYYAVYAATVRAWMSFIGVWQINAVFLFNAAVTSVIPGLLYLATKKITNSNFIALICAVLYAFFPSMIMYTVCVAGENVSQFFMASLFTCLVYAWGYGPAEWKKRWFLLILAAVCGGLLNLYKPILSIILVVIIAQEVVYNVVPAIAEILMQGHYRDSLKRFGASLLCVICFTTIGKGIHTMALSAVNSYFGTETDVGYYGVDNFTEIAYFGLIKEGNGVWNANALEKRDALLTNSDSKEQAHEKMMAELVNQIQESPTDFLRLLHRKMLISWSDEWAYGYYATVSENGISEVESTPHGYLAVMVMPRMYLGMLYWFCAIQLMNSLLKRQKRENRAEGTLMMFFGLFTLVFLVLEAHNRYRSTFMPLLCILSAGGIGRFFDFAIKNNKRFMKEIAFGRTRK